MGCVGCPRESFPTPSYGKSHGAVQLRDIEISAGSCMNRTITYELPGKYICAIRSSQVAFGRGPSMISLRLTHGKGL